jgi:hypothetical protein
MRQGYPHFVSAAAPHNPPEVHMSAVSHQTIKLSKGKHSSPASGACVMELASMLAGEPFTDHPATVSPAIAGFLRAYNDSVDDARRQDLYAYAARVVGSRGTPDVELARGKRLQAWANEAGRARGWTRFVLAGRLPTTCVHEPLDAESAGARAAKAIRRHSDQTHAAVLALVDELLAMDAPVEPLQRNVAPSSTFDPELVMS